MLQLPSLYSYRWRWPIGMLLLLFIIAMYGLPGHWPFFNATPVLESFIDRAVPFNPNWVWIYASYYFMLIAAFFSVKSDRDADNYIWDLGVTALIGTVCFYIYPTEISRTPYAMFEPYNISEKLLWLIRLADRDVNCAPSMHVAMSMVAAASFARNSIRGAIGGSMWAAFIVYSTLATKQHYAIDAVSGAIVATLALEIVRRCRLTSQPTGFSSFANQSF